MTFYIEFKISFVSEQAKFTPLNFLFTITFYCQYFVNNLQL